MEKTELSNRIEGIDLARALAVIGMVIVNFNVVMGPDPEAPGWLVSLVTFFEGKASATFVVLAGTGVSLMGKQALVQENWTRLKTVRNLLLRRALFLFGLGLIFAPFWPGDILHFYGVYITLGALMLRQTSSRLWAGIFCSAGMFVVLTMILDYEKGWHWPTLTYDGFWSVKGMVRHLFFNGFHPVFPWLSFFLLGMWIGRLDLKRRSIRNWLAFSGLALAMGSILASHLLLTGLADDPDLPPELLTAVFGTKPMPPFPLYLGAGAGFAMSILSVCIWLAQTFPVNPLVMSLISVGKMALTHYLAHIVLGLGGLWYLGYLRKPSIMVVLIGSLTFVVFAILFSRLWLLRFQNGPVEIVLRKITA